MSRSRERDIAFGAETRVLTAGFLASLALIAGVAVITVWIVRDAGNRMVRQVEESERTILLADRLGRLSARLWANIIEIVFRPELLAERRTLVNDLADDLTATLADLDARLGPNERPLWRGVERDCASIVVRAGETIERIDRGEIEILQEKYRSFLKTGPEMHARVDGLIFLVQAGSARMRARIDRRLRLAVVFELLAGVMLILGSVAVWMVVMRLVGRQRAQMESAAARLRAANAQLDWFAGSIAHELRNALAPTAIIAGSLETAPGPEQQARLARYLHGMSARAEEIISGLLTYARAGAADPSRTADVRAETEIVLRELEPRIREAGADVAAEIEAPVRTGCPPELLRIVLLNLVGNAVKYLEGRPERRVTVSAGPAEAGFVRIRVEDTGPGIPESGRERLFEPFYRIPGTRVPGIGLGLATVKRIVSACGGDIGVESEPGRGTAFEVRLPSGGPVP